MMDSPINLCHPTVYNYLKCVYGIVLEGNCDKSDILLRSSIQCVYIDRNISLYNFLKCQCERYFKSKNHEFLAQNNYLNFDFSKMKRYLIHRINNRISGI